MLSYIASYLVMASIYGIMALALNFQWGFSGLMNFGIGASYMLGAYTSAILSSAHSAEHLGGFGVPFPVDLIGAALVAGFVAYLIGFPALRFALLELRHHVSPCFSPFVARRRRPVSGYLPVRLSGSASGGSSTLRKPITSPLGFCDAPASLEPGPIGSPVMSLCLASMIPTRFSKSWTTRCTHREFSSYLCSSRSNVSAI